MSNPIELIKNGIQSRNWKEIEAAYFALTGENILGENIDIDLELAKTNQLIKEVDELMDKYRHITASSSKKIKKQKSIIGPFVTLDENGNMVPPKRESSRAPKSLSMGHFGNKSIPLTEEVTQKEIQENESRKINKDKRPPAQKFKVICSQCEKEFDSYEQPITEMGQKCSICLRGSIRGGR